MFTKLTLFLAFLAFSFGDPTAALAQNTKKAVPIVGCYSDLAEVEGNIVGNGVIKISAKKGKYSGTFAQLSNELGLAYDETPLKNILVNRPKLTIRFDITFNRYIITNSYAGVSERRLVTVRGVSGKFSKNGIKMNWRGNSGDYGGSRPFMKRGRKGC